MGDNDESSILDFLSPEDAKEENAPAQPPVGPVTFKRPEPKKMSVGEADTEEVRFLMEYICSCLKPA
jgi:hypothetical protein